MGKIGLYDQKIEFLTDGQVSDGYGGTIPGDVVLLSTFAAIKQLPRASVLEQFEANLPSVYRVSVQAREGFYPGVGMRVRWRGEKYNIITSPTVENVRLQQEWTFDTCRS